MENNRQLLCDLCCDDAIIFENPDYDSAIVGISHDGRVIYDYNLMVYHLMDIDEMTDMDAVDFIDYNTLRSISYAGELAPIVMYKI